MTWLAYSDGGIPNNPETIIFDGVVQTISIKVGTGFDTNQLLTLYAYDNTNNLVVEKSIILTPNLQEVSVAGDAIQYVVISTLSEVFVIDDLTWTEAK